MFYKLSCLLTGFGLMILGLFYTLGYLNLLTIGYNFCEYLEFIIKRYECMIFVVGLCLTIISFYIPWRDENGIYF